MTTETDASQGAAEGQTATEDQDINAGAGGDAGADAGGAGEGDQGGSDGDTGAGAEGGEAGGETGAAPAGEGEQTPPPKKKSAAIQARFDDLTREKYDAERRAEAAETELRRLKGGGGTDGQSGGSGDGAGGDAAMVPVEKVYEVADQIAAAKQFNKRCDDAYDAGEKEFGEDFADSMKQLQIVGAVSPKNLALVEAALETEAPAKVLHALGQDPDEASRLSKLPPVKLGMEVAKLAAKLSAPKPAPAVSKAPAPITPVGGSARADNDIYDPKLSDEEYYARRSKSGAKFMPGSR